MWRPGRWVYIDEEESSSPSPSGHTEHLHSSNHPESNRSTDPTSSSSHPTHQTSSDHHHHHSPPSPPWKLGQVPIETAVFKDGRRMSKRFEKLSREKEQKEKHHRQQQQQQQEQQEQQTTTRKQRSRSVISNANHSSGGQPSNKRARKSITTATRNPSHSPPGHTHHHQSSPTVTQPEGLGVGSENEALAKPSTSSKPSPATTTATTNSSTTAATTNTSTCNDITTSTNNSTADDSSTDPQQCVFGRTTTLSEPPLISPTTIPDPLSTKDTNCLQTQPNPPRSDEEPDRPMPAHPPTEPHMSPPQENDHARQSRDVGECPLNHLTTFLAPPTKKFKPWEALKGIQTDGAEVAVDLKLIQEGHLLRSSSVHQRYSRESDAVHRPSVSSTELSHQASLDTLSSIHIPSSTFTPSLNTATPTTTTTGISCLTKPCSPHSSSDLTELSSSLSDLTDEDQAIGSCSPSMVYSESDLDDDCLPNSLVRKIRRPSTSQDPSTCQIILKRRKKKKKLRKRTELINQRMSMRNPRNLEEEQEEEEMVPPGYIKVKSNVYPFRKPEVSELPPALCGCKEGDCGENCINRAMYYLCDPKKCLLGQSCKNIPFNQRKDLIEESSKTLGKGLKVFFTGYQRGWGLKTEIRLKKGRTFIEYRGEIISRENCYKRVLNDYRNWKDFYFLDYDGSDVIDAGKKGNCTRFINHSCEPNLRVERFKLSGLEEYQFGLVTLRDIEADEELTYNYGWQNFSDIAPTSNIRSSSNNTQDEQQILPTAPTVQRCYCGSKNCKGFLGNNNSNEFNKKQKNKKK